jgi:hypothetical protein
MPFFFNIEHNFFVALLESANFALCFAMKNTRLPYETRLICCVFFYTNTLAVVVGTWTSMHFFDLGLQFFQLLPSGQASVAPSIYV